MLPDKDPKKIEEMFDKIAYNYDKMNDFISFFTHFYIKTSAVKALKVKPYTYVLDLCCGTGDFTSIISKLHPKTRIIGLDFSQNMLKTAKNKYPQNVFIKGDACSLSFKESEFDYVVCGFGLRNIENINAAISEIYRVLKPKGKFLHMDFKRNKLYEKIFALSVKFWLKIIKADEISYNYLLNSIKTFPDTNEIIEKFGDFGFKIIQKRDFLGISYQIFEK